MRRAGRTTRRRALQAWFAGLALMAGCGQATGAPTPSRVDDPVAGAPAGATAAGRDRGRRDSEPGPSVESRVVHEGSPRGLEPSPPDPATASEPTGPTGPTEPGASIASIAALDPLSADERALLRTGPTDDPIPVEIHYIQSNETRHDLFFPYIEDLGGALVGVGSDQSFTLAAAARSELLILMDIDRRVVDLHQIYAVLVPAATDADDLVDDFEAAHADDTLARLQAGLADRSEAERARIAREFRAGRETVLRHLRRVRARTVDGTAASWLSSPAMFEHVQRLHRTGRVRASVGDLAGETSVRTVAAVTRTLGVPVRVLYLSNAEEYFRYTRSFLANLDALPTDDRSVVLRTIYVDTWPHADLWSYQVQPVDDLLGRLADRRNRSRNAMLRHAEHQGAVDRHPGPQGLTLVAM